MKRKLRTRNHRLPIVINITGTTGKTTTAKIIELVLTSFGYHVGLVSSIGLYINSKRVLKHDRTGPTSFQRLYEELSKLDVIICENVLRHIKSDNFYPQKADICIITNIQDDHLHQTKSQTLQEVGLIKSKLITRNKKDGITILNADNRLTPFIIRKRKIKNLVLCTLYKKKIDEFFSRFNPKKIYVQFDETVYVTKKKHNSKKILLPNLRLLPLTFQMQARHNVENIIMALSVIDQIVFKAPVELQNKLMQITPSYDFIPGRCNIYHFENFTVILDDAHNPSSYQESYTLAKNIPHKRIVSVVKASSTRTDDFITRLGNIAGKNSDIIYVKESFTKNSSKRKKLKGKIATLLKEGIKQSGFLLKHMYTILDEVSAVKKAISNAKDGDIVLIFGYRIDRLHSLISRLQKL